MSRFNISGHRSKPAVATVSAPLGTVSRTAPDTHTFEGAPAWKKDAKTDLFLRASASFADGSSAFYESGAQRDRILLDLAAEVAVRDPRWFGEFLPWLRRTANIRTAALMAAAAGVKAQLDAGYETEAGAASRRALVDSVLYRADEPGEMLAFWTATYGRKVPKPVKRGIADAVRRLYSERSLLKYDTATKGYRFGDVLNLVHAAPDPDKPWQGELFQYALDRRHHPDTAVVPESNRALTTHCALMQLPVSERRAVVLAADGQEQLAAAGMTWETLAGWIQGPMDKAAWEAVIPSMGYMALIRNLRNFDEAGVSDSVASEVIARVQSPEQVAKSRQLPFRFYSAYLHALSLRWGHALETALDLCLPNIPEFTGRTLVLTDTSGSMTNAVSDKSKLQCLEAAALFASAVAQRNTGHVDLYQYADFPAKMVVPKGGSVLRMTEAIRQHANKVGWGTNIEGSVRQTYDRHDRVIIFSDAQGTVSSGKSAQGVGSAVPENVPVYLFNIQGYSASPMPTGSAARFDLGGLSDQTFKLIPLLEQGYGGSWPWEVEDTHG